MQSLNKEMLDRMKIQNEKRLEAANLQFANKIKIINSQCDETVGKLQKDFIRDLIENFKGFVQDLDNQTQDMIQVDRAGLQNELEKIQADSMPSQDMVFEVGLKHTQRTISHLIVNHDQLEEQLHILKQEAKKQNSQLVSTTKAEMDQLH